MKQIVLPKIVRQVCLIFLILVTLLWMIYSFDILFKAIVIALLWMILAEIITEKEWKSKQ